MDERYAAIDVAGKGLVIFSAYVPIPRLIPIHDSDELAGCSVTHLDVGVRMRVS